MASPLEENIFDYSDGAIALRTLASLQQDPRVRGAVLDALWSNTRERALFLFNRVCCVLSATRVEMLQRELENLISESQGFVSTNRTPNSEVAQCISRLLAALGIETTKDSPAESAAKTATAMDSWEYHEVVADMRFSRFAGTGKGGANLTPLEDAIRRMKVILIAANHLTPEKNGGKPVSISADFGRAEVLALREYVAQSLGDPA